MGIPGSGPWATLSNMINKKVGDARERKQKMKDQETQTTWKAWEGVLTNPNSTPEERDRAQQEMQKLVPKDSIPIVQGYHKMVNALHQHKQVVGAQGGQPQPGQPGQPSQPGGVDPGMSAPSTPPRGTPQPPGTAGGGGPLPLAPPGDAGKPTGAAPIPPGNGAPPSKSSASPLAAVPPSMSLGQTLSNVNSPERAGTSEGQAAKAKAIAMQGAPDPILEREKKVADYQHAQEAPAQLLKDLKEAGFSDTEAKDMVKEKVTGRPQVGKEPKAQFGPGGGLRAIEDPLTNSTYLSRGSIPQNRPDLLKMWDDAKAEEKATDQKQEAKENRTLGRQLAVQTSAFENAIKRKAYGDAITQVSKAKTKFQDSINRMQTMDKNLQDIAEAKKAGKENQQAMLSMVANHIGMTSGDQPKMRMSKAQWDEAVDSVPYLQRVEAHFDSQGYLSGVVLTQDQMDQMVALAHDKVTILQGAVRRMEQDPDYQEARQTVAAVPPSMKRPGGKGKSAGTGSSKKIVVTDEDMQSVR